MKLGLLTVFLFVSTFLIAIGCGTPPSDTATAGQAVTEPYVCFNGYNPINQPWPTRGVCEWKPSPNCPTCDPYPSVAHCIDGAPIRPAIAP